ncbi:MAG: hypothetical protein ACR2KG_01720 [Nocardioidaceae bacterium]
MLGPNGQTKHVIYLTFDNVHLTRDNPNVPSDLQQMPHLLNFLESNGSLISHHHTPLMSHTGTDLLSAATGLYGDRHGQPISNSYRYFHPDGTSSQANTFTYWTDKVYDGTATPTDTSYSLVTRGGKNTPAPWVPFTRAGCDFGAIASSNAIVENPSADVPKIFGPHSPEARQVRNDPDPYKDAEVADYGGLAIHCAKGSSLCSGPHAVADRLPDEPGGYVGQKMLVGNKYIGPHLTADHSVKVKDIFGKTITNPYAKGPNGGPKPGFPGFDGMTAANTLGYVAAMQEAGVPVTYAYLSDVHDPHMGQSHNGSYGPGAAGMERQLRSYDAAFAAFFTRLRHDGITTANTQFVVTADEGDHFIGVTKSGCDGVHVPCKYGPGQIGEINTNVQGLLQSQRGNTTPFDLYAGVAPAFYLHGNPSASAPATRQLERDTLAVTATNPYTNQREHVNRYLADRTELKLLHMVTADPQRTPTFLAFGRPDYYECQTGYGCPSAPYVQINPAYAWNHGTVAPDVNVTWLGLAGPGIKVQGLDNSTWSDQTDIRPTMLSLLGLNDDYLSDGRVLLEDLTPAATPPAARGAAVLALAQTYKQLNACVGAFGIDTLRAATNAAATGSATNDSAYTTRTRQLAQLGRARDLVAGVIKRVLNQAEFGHQPPRGGELSLLEQRAHNVLARAHQLATT